MSGDKQPTQLYVETPLIESYELSKLAGVSVYLKLENTQPAYTFKLRGISNRIVKAVAAGCKRVVASSGGNAGMASAYSARKLGLPCTIYVPGSTPQFYIDRLRAEGAEVLVEGDVWDHADARARQVAADDSSAVYVHPFYHPDVWEGHSTISTECFRQLGGVTPGLVVASVGGGGLMLGVIQGMDQVGWGHVPVLSMETEGADCFYAAIEAGKIITLPTISSVAKHLGALTVADKLFELHQTKQRPIVAARVSDREAVSACLRYADDHKQLVEPACGAALASVYSGVIRTLQDSGHLPDQLPGPIVIVVCGGYAVTMDRLAEWKTQFGL